MERERKTERREGADASKLSSFPWMAQLLRALAAGITVQSLHHTLSEFSTFKAVFFFNFRVFLLRSNLSKRSRKH